MAFEEIDAEKIGKRATRDYTILDALAGLFGTGLAYGGPGSLVWGWLLTSVFTCFMALSMSELCSSLPVAGGIYYWSYMLSGRHGPFAAWLTAHANFLGQVIMHTILIACSILFASKSCLLLLKALHQGMTAPENLRRVAWPPQIRQGLAGAAPAN